MRKQSIPGPLLCIFISGHRSGCEAAVHAMRQVLEDSETEAILMVASRPGRLKYGLVSIAWVIVHMRKLNSPESGEFVHVSKPL